jgi:hypothetical protein
MLNFLISYDDDKMVNINEKTFVLEPKDVQNTPYSKWVIFQLICLGKAWAVAGSSISL